jgi:hypothetical protein
LAKASAITSTTHLYLTVNYFFLEVIMPFMSGVQDGTRTGRAIRQDYDRARNNATRVIENFSSKKGIREDDLSFANSLLDYLAKRRDENHFFSFNTDQVATRAQFINKMLNALKNNDLTTQKVLLNSKEMLSFKGFFSSRLYDLLVERRGALNERLANRKMESVTTLRQVAAAA